MWFFIPPNPLASYLKALGVLRLISSPANHVSGQAADADARGWWEDERFHLHTTLDRDGLLRFFLEDYAPSPIIAPWNGGSGFYPNDNKDGIGPLVGEQVAERFIPLATAARTAVRTVARLSLTERPSGSDKTRLVATLRAELPDEALPWIDAVLALSGDSLAYPELLGTGGNDGRLDFTNNFMQRLVSPRRQTGLFDATTGEPSNDARSLLPDALLAAPVRGLRSAAIGQFAPGAAGGPNATTGYSSGSESNPWDFVLMLEGATAFAGTATRRHQRVAGGGGAATTRSGASFPFTVRAVGAGWGGVEAADENDARAEFWAPLWGRPTRYCEIDSLLGEGRAFLNGRSAKDGLDFARAVASLGISRGFGEFERFGFLMRAGKAYLAAPIGRRSATVSRGIRLVADLDAGRWIDRVRQVGRADGEPGSARRAVKRLEDALFALLAPTGVAGAAEEALVSLGNIVKWLAVSPAGRQKVGAPPPLLGSDWIREADDCSSEFRVAVALAGIGLPASAADTAPTPADRHVAAPKATDSSSSSQLPLSDGIGTRPKLAPPMAAHFAPIDEKRFFSRRRAWANGDSPPAMVWGTGGLVPNLIAVLERRLVEASIRGLGDKPLAAATFVRLADVAAFLSDDFDDARCAALLAGLVWARPARLRSSRPDGKDETSTSSLPFAYAALKPIFSPDAALHRVPGLGGEKIRMPVPPGLIARLRAGGDRRDGRATNVAVRTALARAAASGIRSPFDPARDRVAVGRIGAGIAADRLAAALLIPVGDYGLQALINRVYSGTLPEDTSPNEDMTHAA